MKRKRIGAKQKEMLARLWVLGRIQWVDLDRDARRGARSLIIHGLVRGVRVETPGPVVYIELADS